MQSVKHPGSNFRTGGATSGGGGVRGSDGGGLGSGRGGGVGFTSEHLFRQYGIP
jgi:hypothetical protein